MPAPDLAAFARILEVLRPAFQPASFANLIALLVGWLRTPGRHAVTACLVATGLAGRRDHAAFHRFFSAAAWHPDALGRALLGWIVARLPPGAPLRLVLDDTFAPHKGPHVFGLGSHLDAVVSTRRRKTFRFGHCWVVLAVVVRLPFAARPWALPLLFRLYRTHADCDRAGATHRKKTTLGRDLLDRVVAWVPDRALEVTGDLAYANGTLVRGLPARVTWFGALRPDAVLTGPPAPGRKVGPPRPKPAALAADAAVPWARTRAVLYGRTRVVAYKALVAQWYSAFGPQLVAVVVVRCASGAVPYRVFVCTDPARPVRAILETYAGRWAIEVFFREAKQLLGFGESTAWTRRAVERVAPFVGLVYTVVTLWAHECADVALRGVVPVRPWYRHKQAASFADLLAAVRRTVAPLDLTTNRGRSDNLAAGVSGPQAAGPPRLFLAA